MSANFEESSALEQKYAGMDLETVIKSMKAIGEDKDAAEEVLKDINKEYDYLRLSLIPKLFDDRGIANMRLTDIGRVSLTSDIYASIPAGKRDEAYLWLSDTGHGDLVSNTVNPSTLKAFLKQMLLKGEEIPEDLFKVTPFTRASITKL